MGRRLVVALASLVLLAGCGGGSASDDLPFSGTRLEPPFEVSSIPLTDTDGEPYSLVGDTDKPLTLVFFGYTHCPDICGVVMANLSTAMTRLTESERAQVDVVYVTTDPARDTGPVLERYLDHVDPEFVGVTGDLGDIVDVALTFGVGVTQGEKLPSGGYEVTHGATITGIDRRDEAPVYWSQETSSAEFASDIRTLLSTKD